MRISIQIKKPDWRESLQRELDMNNAWRTVSIYRQGDELTECRKHGEEGRVVRRCPAQEVKVVEKELEIVIIPSN